MRVLRGEAAKAWSLPLTWVLLVVGVGLGAAIVRAQRSLVESISGPDAVRAALPYLLLAAVVWGASAMGSELDSGQFGTTLLATPRRLPLAAAKAVMVAFGGIVMASGAVLGGRFLLGGAWTPDDRRVWAASSVALAAVAVIAWSLTALARNFVAGLVLSLALVTVLPVIAAPWRELVGRLPSALALVVAGGPGVGAEAFRDAAWGLVVWVAVPLAAATISLAIRDP